MQLSALRGGGEAKREALWLESDAELVLPAEIERLITLVQQAQGDATREQVIIEALDLGLKTMLAIKLGGLPTR